MSRLELVKKEMDLSQKSVYADVLPVTFESKVRLVLSILKVNLKKKILEFYEILFF